MADKPILFSAPMVNAILRGAKSQTRRVIKPNLVAAFDVGRGPADSASGYPFVENEYGDHISAVRLAPYQVGDTLWVRETVRGVLLGDVAFLEYAATCATDDPCAYPISFEQYEQVESKGWRPSIFMPRWASRITLRVTNVRVQRLQDISEIDCEQEIGVPLYSLGNSAYQQFSQLWESINAKRGYSWNSNCWVWAYTFKAVQP